MTQRKPGRRANRGNPVVPRKAKVTVATLPEEQIIIRVPSIVPKTLFEEVRSRMDENRKRQRERQVGSKYLLSGLLICGKCGSAYCHQGKPPSGYYRCIGTGKYRRSGATLCNNLSVRSAELETCVWSDLCDLLADPERIKSEFARRNSESTGSTESLAKQTLVVNNLHGRIKRLIDAYDQGLIELSEFEPRVVNLRSQLNRENAALASLQG